MLTLLYMIDAACVTLISVALTWLSYLPLVTLLVVLSAPVVGLLVLLGTLVRHLYARTAPTIFSNPDRHRAKQPGCPCSKCTQRRARAALAPPGNPAPVRHVQTVVPPAHHPDVHPIFGAPVPRPGGFRR